MSAHGVQTAVRLRDPGKRFDQSGWAGRSAAFAYSVTRTATVAATIETTLLRVGREAFLSAMRAHPSVSAAADAVARDLLGVDG